MAKEKKVADLNNSDTKEMLTQYIQSLQKVERNIKQLNEEKSDIQKEMRDEGFSTKIINQVISDIRKQLKATPSELAEKEVYFDVLAKVVEEV
jgi:uncharacterized protein (UPF0335 family)